MLLITTAVLAAPLCPRVIHCDKEGTCRGTTRNGHDYVGQIEGKYKTLGNHKSGEMHKAGIECYYEHGKLTVFMKNQNLPEGNPIKLKHDKVTDSAVTIHKSKK